MSFRSWRRVRIAPGITLNLSKSGGSLSFGSRGEKFTIGQRGKRATVGIPERDSFTLQLFQAGVQVAREMYLQLPVRFFRSAWKTT